MIASAVDPICLAGDSHLIERDRLDLETDVGDELIEFKAVFVPDPGIEDDGGFEKIRHGDRCLWSLQDVWANCSASGSSRKIATRADVSTTISGADHARHNR
jgi:hypothetical protein